MLFLLAEQDGLENKLAQIKHVIRLEPLAQSLGGCKKTPSCLEKGHLGWLNQLPDIQNFLLTLRCPPAGPQPMSRWHEDLPRPQGCPAPLLQILPQSWSTMVPNPGSKNAWM